MHVSAEPEKAGITHVKMVISYKGVDAKWFSDISPLGSSQTKSKTGFLPSVIARVGKHETLEIIQEYRLVNKGPVVPCGIIVDLTPELVGDSIRISGMCVLRYATNKDANGVATRFTAQENLINFKLEDGKTEAVDIEGGGQITITATLVDTTGSPIKK